MSIITAPAVNAGVVNRIEQRNIPNIEPTMFDRIEKVLALAAIHQHDSVILGAWGCGVFKNNPVDVASWFYTQLTDNPNYRGLFRMVVFAILDTSENQDVIRPFEERFRSFGKERSRQWVK